MSIETIAREIVEKGFTEHEIPPEKSIEVVEAIAREIYNRVYPSIPDTVFRIRFGSKEKSFAQELGLPYNAIKSLHVAFRKKLKTLAKHVDRGVVEIVGRDRAIEIIAQGILYLYTPREVIYEGNSIDVARYIAILRVLVPSIASAQYLGNNIPFRTLETLARCYAAIAIATRGLDEEDTNPTGFRYLLIAIAMKRAREQLLSSQSYQH